MPAHAFTITTNWTGNLGAGTTTYDAYERSHEFHAEGKPVIQGSSAPAYRGDASRYNPEELLLASVSACHMLWYLHLCTEAGVVVRSYSDAVTGELKLNPNGSGEFKRIELRPRVTIARDSDERLAHALHVDANRMCFIARSLKCEVDHVPHITTES